MAHNPCWVCEKSIDYSKQSSIFCDLCKFWVHTKCNQWNFLDFQHIKACSEQWFCSKCINDLFPFGTLNQNFSLFAFNNKNSNANTGSSINLKPPQISVYYLINSVIYHETQSIKIQKTRWPIVSTVTLMTYKKLNPNQTLSLYSI